MATLLNAKELKEQASIVALLSKLGYKPVSTTFREKFYHSMIRDDDHNASFAVNDHLSVWYDHGLRKGGNIIDFGLLYWKDLSFSEVIEKIQAVNRLSGREERKMRKRSPVKIPNYIVQEIKSIGTNPLITRYLEGLGIFKQAAEHLNEVYYYVENGKGERKQFFAAGCKNELGSWEVCNQYFKGSLGHNALTFISRSDTAVSIFQGCLSYLSWRTDNVDAADSILILNAASLEAVIRKIRDFLAVSIYLDQDDTGRLKSAELIQALPHATDCSPIYKGHINYNEMFVQRIMRTITKMKRHS